MIVTVDPLPLRQGSENRCQRLLALEKTRSNSITSKNGEGSRLEQGNVHVISKHAPALKYIGSPINKIPLSGRELPNKIASISVIVEHWPGDRVSLEVLDSPHREMFRNTLLNVCSRGKVMHQPPQHDGDDGGVQQDSIL